MSDSGKAVFLSYASQDKEAAKSICDALRAAGLEVWFDVSELRGGDAWDQKIRQQIKECALFVPIISATTNARPEGYFRLEWKLAVDRSHLLADDHPFLFPIVIGDVADATARVPEKFREVQWTRLRLDETPAELAGRIARLLGGENVEAGRPRPAERGAGAASAQKFQPSWLRYAWAGVGIIFALIYAVRPLWQASRPVETKAIPTASAAGVQTEAQKLVQQAEPASESLRRDPRFGGVRDSAMAPEPVAPAAPKADEKSVAVLAFANLSDDKGNEYFSDGISEELLNVLAKIPNLKVAARTSAFYFKGKEVPVPEIAKQLGVAYVVEGSVRKAGDRVRITAQLIKAADGFHVWSDTFTRDIKDVFAVQDEIAGLIARNISPVLNPPKAAGDRTMAPEAIQEYLAGRSAAATAGMASLREAVGHFERAVALEPKFTAAWVQLANTHTQLGRWGGAPAPQSWRAARAAIDRARALEPDAPEVLLALGWIMRTGEWDWPGAERAFRRALELRPQQPEVLAGTAVLLFNIGRVEEAFRLGKQAAQLDPLNAATQIDLSIMFYLHGDLAEAEAAARRALQLAPNGTSYHAILAWSLIDQGRFAEAEAEIALDPDPVEQPTARARLALARGDTAEARQGIAQLEALARTNPDLADLQQSIAWICSGLGEGERDRAFAALLRARDSRDPSMAWLLSSRYLVPLQSDPRWPALVRSLGLAGDQLQKIPTTP
mgnify:CR=1 FL=1